MLPYDRSVVACEKATMECHSRRWVVVKRGHSLRGTGDAQSRKNFIQKCSVFFFSIDCYYLPCGAYGFLASRGLVLSAYAGFCQHPFKNLFLRITFRHVCHVRSRGFVSLVGRFHRQLNGTDVEQFDELLNKQNHLS